MTECVQIRVQECSDEYTYRCICACSWACFGCATARKVWTHMSDTVSSLVSTCIALLEVRVNVIKKNIHPSNNLNTRADPLFALPCVTQPIQRTWHRRKVDSQLQSRIRLHVPKDSFLIYNCVPRKLKRQSSLNQMPIFAIFSTL